MDPSEITPWRQRTLNNGIFRTLGAYFLGDDDDHDDHHDDDDDDDDDDVHGDDGDNDAGRIVYNHNVNQLKFYIVYILLWGLEDEHFLNLCTWRGYITIFILYY